MPRSQMFLQLFLGWALLLGRTVCGTEDWFEEQQSLLEGDLEGPPETLEQGEEEEVASAELEERLREDEMMVEGDPMLKEEMIDHFSAMAMDYFNKDSYGPLYKVLDEDKSLTFKKAIGTMAYLQLFLGKTNCTNAEMGHGSMWAYTDLIHRMPLWRKQPLPELRRCALPPPSEREALDCTFDIFLNERSHWEKVMGHQCKRLEIEDPGEFYSSVEW